MVVLAVVAVAVTAFRVWHAGRQDARPRSDAIVVLGSAQYNGRPSAVLGARLDHAAALWKTGAAPRIITVGGGLTGDTFTEAEAGTDYLRRYGLPAADIVTIGEGSDTLRELRAATALMQQRGWRSAVIVTDPWHSLRARRMATDLGLHAVTSPTRSGPAVQDRTTEVRYIGRETAAYLFYLAFGDANPPKNRPPAF